MKKTIVAGLLIASSFAVADHVAAAPANTNTPIYMCEEGVPGPRPCVWDAKHLGNGEGHSYIETKDGRVKFISHTRAHRLFTYGR